MRSEITEALTEAYREWLRENGYTASRQAEAKFAAALGVDAVPMHVWLSGLKTPSPLSLFFLASHLGARYIDFGPPEFMQAFLRLFEFDHDFQPSDADLVWGEYLLQTALKGQSPDPREREWWDAEVVYFCPHPLWQREMVVQTLDSLRASLKRSKIALLAASFFLLISFIGFCIHLIYGYTAHQMAQAPHWFTVFTIGASTVFTLLSYRHQRAIIKSLRQHVLRLNAFSALARRVQARVCS